MKKTFLVLSLFLAANMSMAANSGKHPNIGEGKQTSFQSLFDQYIEYPEMAKREKIETTVVLEFCIEESGEITNIRSLTDQGYDLENEAIRVLQLMSVQHKEAIALLGMKGIYRLPVSFDLD